MVRFSIVGSVNAITPRTDCRRCVGNKKSVPKAASCPVHRPLDRARSRLQGEPEILELPRRENSERAGAAHRLSFRDVVRITTSARNAPSFLANISLSLFFFFKLRESSLVQRIFYRPRNPWCRLGRL